MKGNLRILVADNNPQTLKYTTHFLKRYGYSISIANSREEAEYALEHNHLHLAILDMRLNDDTDDKDRSGIYLAQNFNRSIPKIINTKYPNHQAAIEALRPDTDNLPPAVDFVNKLDGLPTLYEAVERSIAKHIRLNWELSFAFNDYLSFTHLLERIGYLPTDPNFSERLIELTDLFRKLFLDAVQVTISHVLKQRANYMLLCIYLHRPDQQETGYILSIGHHDVIKEKWRRYETAVTKTTRLARSHTAHTTHLGAIAYQSLDGDIIHASNLGDYYFLNGGQTTYTALDYLLTEQFPAWHHTGKTHQPASSVRTFYQPDPANEQIDHLLTKLCEELTITELGRWRYEKQQIRVTVKQQGEVVLPNPFTPLLDPPEEVIWGTVHGQIDCESIQVLPNQHALLIDFAHVQEGPLLHDYTSLESNILCYLMRPSTPDHIFHVLNTLDSLDDDTNPSATDDPFLALILLVRHHTCENLNCQRTTYLIHAIYNLRRLLLTYDTERHYDPRTLAPYAIALLVTSFWTKKVSTTPSSPSPTSQPFVLDRSNRHVMINGRSIDLTPQEYKLLNYMVEREQELCTKKQLIEDGLDDYYDPDDLEQARLTSSISRLRKKIELDGLHFIQTVRGHGYKFSREQ